jgi:hypothetical protein
MTERQEQSLHLVPDASPSSVHTRVAMLEDELAGLRKAMETRAVIEQAKGMLRMMHRISDGEAFNVLIRWSQAHNVKLAVVATAFVGICSAAPEGARSLEQELDGILDAVVGDSGATTPPHDSAHG